MGAAVIGHFGRRVRRGLPASDRLCEPRLEAARNEPYTMDAGRHLRAQSIGHPSLFRAKAPADPGLSAMWERRRGGIQFLSSLQLQTGTELSAMPAHRQRERRVLSLLRSPAANGRIPGLWFPNHISGLRGLTFIPRG